MNECKHGASNHQRSYMPSIQKSMRPLMSRLFFNRSWKLFLLISVIFRFHMQSYSNYQKKFLHPRFLDQLDNFPLIFRQLINMSNASHQNRNFLLQHPLEMTPLRCCNQRPSSQFSRRFFHSFFTPSTNQIMKRFYESLLSNRVTSTFEHGCQ